MRRLLLAVLIVCAVATGAARARPVAGQVAAGRVVVDGPPRRPVPGVRVRVLRAGRDSAPRDSAGRDSAGRARAADDTIPVGEAITALDGAFSVLLPGPGTYRVRIGETFVAPPMTLADPDSTDAHLYVLPALEPGPREPVRPSSDAELDALLRAGVALQPTQVDQPACLATASEPPPYPPMMASMGAVASFGALVVVDTSGRPDVRTLRILNPADPGFVRAAREWVPRLHMSPARLRGRRVPQVMWIPFTFGISGQPRPPRPQPPRGFELATGTGQC